MTNGSGLSGYPDIQPPITRATAAWKHLLTAWFIEVPKYLRRSAAARRRMARRLR